jgi:hypothetical protein
MRRAQDLDTYTKAAVTVAKKYFAISDIEDFYKKKDARPLMFCHFARSVSDKTYDEVCGLAWAPCDVLVASDTRMHALRTQPLCTTRAHTHTHTHTLPHDRCRATSTCTRS